jgi:ADP-ribosylglycohydrolase
MNVKIINKILGLIYGQALVDAYGLATEFKTRKWVEKMYGENPIPFPNFEKNVHNIRWKSGDWTDDTDGLIMIMQSLTESNGKLDQKDLAQRFVDWMEYGFPECDDNAGMGIGSTIYKVLSHPNYLFAPSKIAKKITIETGSQSNGALMRNAICACHPNYEQAIQNTILACQTTHHHEAVIACCVFMTSALHSIIFNNNIDEDKAYQEAIKYITDPKELSIFTQQVQLKPECFTDVKFDGPNIGWIYICFQAFLIGLRVKVDETNQTETFKKLSNLLIRQGGDADTNGAVFGAVLGARIGFQNCPQDWIKHFPYKEWLDKQVNTFLSSFVTFE